MLKKLKIPCDVVLCSKADTSSAEDTKLCAQIMKEQGVDLLVFCGGDGTARDICEAVGTDVTVLGIPAGVKMYSACYACNPYQAGEMLAGWLEGKEMSYEMREVLDIEEKDLDSRNVSPQLYGFLEVLSDGKHLQKAKELDLGSGESATIIARAAILRMEKDWVYIIGPGGTTWKIKSYCVKMTSRRILGKRTYMETVRGVDVIRNGKIILRDANERELWDCVNSYSPYKNSGDLYWWKWFFVRKRKSADLVHG